MIINNNLLFVIGLITELTKKGLHFFNFVQNLFFINYTRVLNNL